MVLLKSFSSVYQTLVIILFVTLAIFIAKYYFQKRRLFRLGSKLPGPKGWPFIGNVLQLPDFHSNMLCKVNEYHQKYDLFAIWFGHYLNVFVKSPEDAEIYCSSSKLIHRGDRFNFLYSILGKGLLLASGSEWKKAKRITESAFPYAALKNFIGEIQKEGQVLINRLEKEEGKSSFEMMPYLMECTLDVTNEIAFQTEIKAQDGVIDLIDKVERMLDLAFKKIFTVWQNLDFFYPFCQDGKEFYENLNSLLEYVGDIVNKEIHHRIEEKKADIGTENDLKPKRKQRFWQNMLRIFQEEDLDLEEIKNHIFTMILTGYHTTSNALSFILTMLALHEDVQNESYEELIAVVHDGVFDGEKLKELQYLERVIKETLRLFPIVPINYRKATEDITMGQYTIPAGADVSLNIAQLHRDPNQYKNANEFNPDNFLPENVSKRHPYAYIPFSAGHRKCIGDKFAMAVLKVITGMILLNYKIECDYKSLEDIPTAAKITLEMTDRCRIRLLKR